MTTQFDLTSLAPKERRDYGFARVRDAAFDAVSSLWTRRQNEGLTQVDLANAIGADPGWVSKNLRGPGNWTMRTFGTFVEGLDGEAQITIRAAEDPLPVLTNYHAYVGYEPEITVTFSKDSISQNSISQKRSASSISGPSILRGRLGNISVLIP
jgi:hypothetical protein